MVPDIKNGAGSVLDEPIVLVDIETNGLNHIRGRILEVAAIRIEHGEITASLNQLVDPETDIPAFITNLTGITNHDVSDAPTFGQIAEDLHDILDGAIFVAHNVRFDYSFLKQEFKRVGRDFSPRQLCTVRLSRALYPEHRTHKLADIIARHQIRVAARHRAYDDAAVLWEFLQIVRRDFAADVLHAALSKQLKQPSMPKGLDPDVVAELPDGPGVYIFEDEAGRPIYIGKSIHVRTRVKSHFSADHEHVGEFKISQHIRNVRVRETTGELEALLLESQLVKELQPLYNKQLRRLSKLLLVRQVTDLNGYHHVRMEEANGIDPEDIGSILAVYTKRSQAKESLNNLVKDFSLCPKLLGLEKASNACFMYQLHKCRGACVGDEPAGVYNERLLEAFERKRVEAWPYRSPVLVTETNDNDRTTGVVVDQWCVIGQLAQEPYCSPVFTPIQRAFDLDTYKILRSHLADTAKKLRITPLSPDDLAAFSA
jgi:DNA polymerase-3 subunit epsilon